MIRLKSQSQRSPSPLVLLWGWKFEHLGKFHAAGLRRA